jgi:hypothetical protein
MIPVVRDRDRVLRVLRGQVRAITQLHSEFWEGTRGRWFTASTDCSISPPTSGRDWLTVCLANAGAIVALMLAWMYAGAAPRGDLMAGT